MEKYNINTNIIDSYGPRSGTGYCVEGTNPPRDCGVDQEFTDVDILRFCYAFKMKVPDIISNMYYHLEWRKTYVPRPRMQEEMHQLLQSGILYMHGRCIDHTPIMVLDLSKLSVLLKTNQINNYKFCALNNFFARYIMANMLVPGQVEKYITITNLN